MPREVTVWKDSFFRAILDKKTDRPHLVQLVYPKRNGRKWKNIMDLPVEMLEQWVVSTKNSFYSLKPCIFSVHLGYYQRQDSPHFHAHYYFAIDDFLDWIDKWGEPSEVNHKLLKWQNRIDKEGAKYKRMDLVTLDTGVELGKPLPRFENYKFWFHRNQPRIAFKSKKGHRGGLLNLILTMMQFIVYYELDDKKKGGCHLCIQNGLYIDEQFDGIAGFIQIDIVNYYRMNPKREMWLERFKKVDYAVYT